MSDRGMKKWAPYSSLIEQATCLEEMRYERNKVEKPTITQDRIEKINFILQNYRGQPLKIRFWHDGYFYIINKPIKKQATSHFIVNRLLHANLGIEASVRELIFRALTTDNT